jgi:methionyl-tRNA synthetase
LVATYGNLVNRVLTFTYRNFDGKIPTPQPLDEVDEGLLRSARSAMDEVGVSLRDCRFKAAINRVFALAQESNRYLDAKAPWRSIKESSAEAATSLWVAIGVINCLKVLLHPFMPFSSQRLHEYLGFDGRVEDCGWDFDAAIDGVRAGRTLRQPSPLYAKLGPEVVEEEVRRLGVGAA